LAVGEEEAAWEPLRHWEVEVGVGQVLQVEVGVALSPWNLTLTLPLP